MDIKKCFGVKEHSLIGPGCGDVCMPGISSELGPRVSYTETQKPNRKHLQIRAIPDASLESASLRTKVPEADEKVLNGLAPSFLCDGERS